MTNELLQTLLAARERREPCALVTVAATQGSVPREAGAKMLVFSDGHTQGTIGGGKFEALVTEEALAALQTKAPLLKTYPLHEADPASFGAICGGEMTVLIEPQILTEALFIVGAGHCARAVAELARRCGLGVTVADDRTDLLGEFPEAERSPLAPVELINSRTWRKDEALVLVSRNYHQDREALHAALQRGGMGYLGMIGSRKKVRQVYEELRARGVSEEQLSQVYAPIGLDVAADSPMEIAVSVLAEILAALRGRSAGHLRDRR